MFLSNRSAIVPFKRVKSAYSKKNELGTPQGGELYPMLLNVLMYRLLVDIPLASNDSIIYYAVDNHINPQSEKKIQQILNPFIKDNGCKEFLLIDL